ncbi:hypothetical protein PC9H_009705 [Pleurotus ostreatus]|uniref:3-carboxymuconate cyclase n=3 Tax=Pleurotus TaxID=5320 RepID=A0A8H6ZMC0_PLEOS|nr:uncharacterized protein PC9H_009705 [Pleurotus ostreatus]KAF7424398.1 hypothetical protein PC9H_009705 [Pleurotus ostreatus]KAG9224843.1 hypothetical protein CCMSSC00406_0002006 [Pleurotus cornucopiae]KAJ8692662.1 hypothetical protein PTI98_009957 [Pleurotus ostreatus]
MKLSIASVLLSLVLVSVSARPLDSRQTRKNSNRKQMGNASGVAAGAAYFITNEPDGNFIVAADIGNDGKLTLRRAIGTGGLGEHGITDPNGPDPLFTQGAIKASSAANVLATVNPGSNTLSLFTIDPNDPTNLQVIGAPVGSGGEFPVSLAFNKDGSQLCALNGGAINGVNCFAVDKQRGLVSLANTNRALNLNQTTPATGPAGSVSHIVFSEDGQTLVASVKGVPPTPGFLAAWAVQQDGSLSDDFQKIDPADGGLLPFSMTVIPGKNAILATDAGLGFDIFDFGGNASSAVKIDGQSATCWSSFSKKTGNFYLTDIGTSIVTEVNVDDNLTGTIVKQYAQGQGTATIDNDIVTVGNNDFMYVLAANATTIDVLALNAPGKAQTIQKLGVAATAQKANLKLSAFNVQGMTTFVRQ